MNAKLFRMLDVNVLMSFQIVFNVGADLRFHLRRPKYKKKKNPNKYSYGTNKLSTKINIQNHYFLIH